jgi:hypothetical protein
MLSTDILAAMQRRPGAPHSARGVQAPLRKTACLVAGALSLCLPTALSAQGTVPSDPPVSVPVRLGPVAIAPAISVTHLGWDSNVFHRDAGSDPVGDFVATATPQVRSWARLGRVRLQARNTLDFVYFQEYSNERSIDGDHEGRVDVPLARLTPYVSGRWLRARQRFGFEIDERIRRHGTTAVAGVDVRIGPRTNIDVSARRTRLEFSQTAGMSDLLVRNFYDHTSQGVALSVRQRLTPLTALSVTVDTQRDEFDLVPWRDSDSLRITSGVEFQPFALVSGRASVGWRKLELVSPGAPAFSGLVTSVDLAYTLLGATRFAVQAARDVSYSAFEGQHAFLLSGMTGSVAHRFGGGWDAMARAGRHRVSYELFGLGTVAAAQAPESFGPNRETVTELGGQVGYRLGPDVRLAFDLGQFERRSTVLAGRGYGRTRATVSISYGF